MTASAVRARPYRPADRDACLAVFDSNVPDFFVTPEREEFAAFLDDLPGPYLVLVEARDRGDGRGNGEDEGRGGGGGDRDGQGDDGGDVVACGGWAIDAETRVADLCWGMVRRDRHRTGLGRLLTAARLDGVRGEGAARAVKLHTSQHTTGFYERLGFVVHSVVEDGYAPGLHRCDMRLELAGDD